MTAREVARSRRRRSGHAVIEVALMAPWILLLFLAIFNFGFFMYAGISVANAARVAALELGRYSGNALDQSLACTIVRRELRSLPNSSFFNGSCSGAPLTVTVPAAVGPGWDAGGNPNASMPAAQVRVTYETIQLFPLPWLAGRMTLSRQVDIRVYE